MEESVIRWARQETARQDTSVSRLPGDFLKERMHEKDSYDRAVRQALGRTPFLKTASRYLSREEVLDRDRLSLTPTFSSTPSTKAIPGKLTH